ncbi:MAG: hypothetical protein P8184_17800 [Calditrichia bacterium]
MNGQRLLFSIICFAVPLLYFSSCGVDKSPVNFISGHLHWEPANGPYGGKVNHIVQGPDSRILAAMDYGGVYLSGNLGESWEYIGLRTVRIVKLFVDSYGVYWAGSDYGLYSSKDEGENWHRVEQESFGQIYQIYEDSAGGLFIVSIGRLFYRHERGGIWQKIEAPESAAIRGVAVGKSGALFVTTTKGLYRSINSGSSWEKLPIDIWDSMIAEAGNGNLLLYGASTDGSRIFLSKDDFRTWKQILEISGPIYNLSLDAEGNYYLGAQEGLYFSDNEGQAWHLLMQECTFGIAPTRQGVLLAATGDGIVRSADAGLTWEESNYGLMAFTFNALAVSPLTGEVYACGPQGLYCSIDQGESWQKRSDDYFTGTLAVNIKGFIYAAYGFSYSESLWRSADGGAAWRDVSPPARVNALAFGPSEFLYTATMNGVYYSPDNGHNWLSAGLQEYDLTSVAVAGERILAGWLPDLFYSDDNGRNWVQRDTLSVRQICVNSWGHIFLNDNLRIRRSVDGGKNWKVLYLSPEGKGARIISLLCAPRGGLMVATHGNGILVSADDGDHWQVENEGLPSKYIDVLAMDPNGRVYAGARGGSIYRTRGFTD